MGKVCEMGSVEKKLETVLLSEEQITNSSQISIIKICDAIKKLLLEKNIRYGDAALQPKNIFFRGNATESILCRLDDKISRIINNKEIKPRCNDLVDLIGYLVLLLISMGITEKDIENLID
jgi:hypothetical protein